LRSKPRLPLSSSSKRTFRSKPNLVLSAISCGTWEEMRGN
jgi:hypothetical protein